MARATALWLCSVCILISACVAANLVRNPSFESGRSSWSQFHQGYSVDSTYRHTGVNSIRCASRYRSLTYGLYQIIKPSTPLLAPITISTYASIAPNTTGGGSFGFNVVIRYTNGKWGHASYTQFSLTASGWQYGSITPSLAGPVKEVWVYLTSKNLKGTVWFDDVSVLADGATTTTTLAPTTTTTTTTPAPTTTTTTTTTTPAPTTTTPEPTTTTTTPEPTTTTPEPTTTTPAPTTTTTTPEPTTTTTGAPFLVVGLRYLIVSGSTNDPRLLAAAKTFDSVGAQYDVAIVTDDNSALSLTASDGSGKYIGIVTTDDILPIPVEPQLTSYQLTYNVRWVVMYSFPHAQDGVGLVSSPPSPGIGGYLSFASDALSYTRGYTSGAAFFTGDAWKYPSSVVSSIATPALNLLVESDSYVGAVFVSRTDGTQRLVFLIDQSPYHTHSIGLGSFWLQWVSNNFYLGLRRVYLNCHADDLFLNSDRWNVEKETQDYTLSYRINATELQDFANFQSDLNARLPAGSNITVSFPFNGAGVAEAEGYANDKLFIKTKALVSVFLFQSHTYSHPELDDLTRAQVEAELTNNFDVTLKLFEFFQNSRYANTSMVTPSISGLFNGQALQALWNEGIRAVVGDNTRPELRTPFPYHGFYTTGAINGFDGIYIMPREATEIYYDCSDHEEQVSEYNSRYRNFFGYNSTFEQIIEREVARVIQLVLAFRYDSHMFHQINLHEFWYNGQKHSLLSTWIDAITTEYSKYYSLPVYSHNQDILTQKWQDRDARDACGFNGKVYINPSTKQIVSVSGVTSNSCNIALTGLDVSSSATVSTEVYGVDKTVWVTATANTPFTLTLNTPIQL